MFPSPKDRPPPENQTNVVYQIGCSDCPWNYIGETGRAFNTRKKEHIRNVKLFKDGSNIAKHAWTFDHKIDFGSSKIIDKGNYRHRLTLESWHTAITTNACSYVALLWRRKDLSKMNTSKLERNTKKQPCEYKSK